MSKFEELADKAKFEALLMFEDDRKFAVDLYPMGESETGTPMATLEMTLDYPEAPGGRFTLLGDWPGGERPGVGEAEFTPGPWTVTPYLTPERDDDPMGVYKVSPAHETLTGRYFGTDPEAAIHAENAANARLLGASLTMYGKIKDTVAWLDREVETWEQIVTKESAQMLFKLTELRDDLAETLRVAGKYEGEAE